MWRWLTIPPASKGAWLLRGVALLLVRGLISLAPSATLTTLAFLAGLVIFFIGLRELFRLLMHALPELELPKEPAEVFVAEEGGSTLGRVVLVGAVAVVFIGVGVFFSYSHRRRAAMPATVIRSFMTAG